MGGMILLAAAAAVAQQVTWTTLRDTQEQAFSVDVPQGWKAQGGLLRKGPLDPRVEVDMTSPDGRISMRLGDFAIGPFTVPSRQLEMAGFTEGKTYAPGHPPTATIVARYRSGREFADLYGQARFSQLCQTLELKSLKSEDPIFHPAHQGNMSITAGEAVYRCVSGGQEKVAFVYSETSLTQIQTSSVWASAALLSFIAPKDRAQAAYSMVFHSASTFTENPQWTIRQMQITQANVAAALANFRQGIAESTARYEKWSANMTRQTQNFSDALNGQTLTLDPATGQKREVWTGTGATRWINPLGDVVSSNLSPGASYRALQDISH